MKNHTPIIRHKQYEELQEIALECMEFSYSHGEPHCMSIEGPTGVGKTTFIENTINVIKSRFPNTNNRILLVKTPDNPTLKSIISGMLETTNSPDAGKIKYLWEAKQRLKSALKSQNIQLVVFDDFQHLVTSHHNNSSHTNLGAIGEFLKATIKETEIPHFIVGIEGEIEEVLKKNKQLSRLFAVREKLKPFELNMKDPESIKSFQSIIKHMKEIYGTDFDTEDNEIEFLRRIEMATDGVMANIHNLIRQADKLASKEGNSTITRKHLEKAFERRLAKHLEKNTNPFSIAFNIELAKPTKSAKTDANENINDILKT